MKLSTLGFSVYNNIYEYFDRERGESDEAYQKYRKYAIMQNYDKKELNDIQC